jgi:hypothetical protein
MAGEEKLRGFQPHTRAREPQLRLPLMVGEEKLGGLQPETQAKEPQLRQPDIGKNAYRLIQEDKQALLKSPELGEVLKELYFYEVPHDVDGRLRENNPFVEPIMFRRGDYNISINYLSENEFEALDRTIYSPKPGEHTWASKSTKVQAAVNSKSGEFDSGTIQHVTRDKNGKVIESHINTLTAIQKVAEDRETYLGTS